MPATATRRTSAALPIGSRTAKIIPFPKAARSATVTAMKVAKQGGVKAAIKSGITRASALGAVKKLATAAKIARSATPVGAAITVGTIVAPAVADLVKRGMKAASNAANRVTTGDPVKGPKRRLQVKAAQQSVPTTTPQPFLEPRPSANKCAQLGLRAREKLREKRRPSTKTCRC